MQRILPAFLKLRYFSKLFIFVKCQICNKYLSLSKNTEMMDKLQRKIILLFLVLLSIQLNAQKIYSCNSKYDSNIKVFVVNSKYDADLLVYKTDSPYDATDNKGLWYFCSSRYDAKKRIWFSESKYDADLLIFFVDSKYDAGWRNREKMYLLY